MRNPNYHQMTDTIQTLDLNFFSEVVDGWIIHYQESDTR